jgi:hypothetical protein
MAPDHGRPAALPAGRTRSGRLSRYGEAYCRLDPAGSAKTAATALTEHVVSRRASFPESNQFYTGQAAPPGRPSHKGVNHDCVLSRPHPPDSAALLRRSACHQAWFDLNA